MLASGYALIMDPVAVAPKKGRRGRRGRKEARKGGKREKCLRVLILQFDACVSSHFTELEMIHRIWGTVLKDENG